MQFKVIKASLDGISAGGETFTAIKDVLKEISFHRGWDSLKQLHTGIKNWAKKAKPGDVFTTHITAVIAVGVSRLDREDDRCHHCGNENGLDYGEMDGVEGGDIEQEIACPECGKKWIEVFVLAEQREIAG